MRRAPKVVSVLLVAALLGLGGYWMASGDDSGAPFTAQPGQGSTAPKKPMRSGSVAALPDKGVLVGYPSTPVVHRQGASTWYRADISETHALQSVISGEMTVEAPNGTPLRFQYQRHLEHPNGNWTWIGRNADGEEAIVTFGEKAVFGTIPSGENELRLTTMAGRTWVIEVDPRKERQPEPKQPDYLIPPELTAALASSDPSTAADAPTPAAAGATAATTVDVALGYTTGYASELGGDSQAVTRLQHLVDVTNQAYVNSQIDAQVRLVKTVSVAYPDATDNNDTLYKLTGYKDGSSISVDPAFAQLRAARDQYGADLVSLVRRFRTPENDGCGLAWLIGGGQESINSTDIPFGYSVVSDDIDKGDLDESDGKTYACRKESLAHELGHNMGQQHNVEDSAGKAGAHAYSYGYRESTSTGFYTVMAYRLTGSSQRGVRYFANPNVNESVSGRPTGVANSSDNARSMAQTMPLIAAFRATVVPMAPTIDLFAIGKVGNSGSTEVHVLSALTSYQSFLLNTTSAIGSTGTDYVWRYQLGDFNHDGILDLFAIYRMGQSGRTEVHVLDGASRFKVFLLHSATALLQTGAENSWMFRVGDYNRDGQPDLYAIARNGASGRSEVHVLNGANNFSSFLAHIALPLPSSGNDGSLDFALGDQNADGVLDLYLILKSNTGSGRTEVHVMNGATNFTTFTLHAATVLAPTGTNNAWVFKVGDYTGDGAPDLFAIGKSAASARTEVHVLDGSDGFQTFRAHIATALGATGVDNAWEIELGQFR